MRNVDYQLTAAGTRRPITPMNGKYYTTQEYEFYIGSPDVEHGPMYNGMRMLFNPEGKIWGLPLNIAATGILKELDVVDYIAGDVIFIEPYRENESTYRENKAVSH